MALNSFPGHALSKGLSSAPALFTQDALYQTPKEGKSSTECLLCAEHISENFIYLIQVPQYQEACDFIFFSEVRRLVL